MFGHVQFAYRNDRSWDLNFSDTKGLFNPPDYICYNEELCDHNIILASPHQPAYVFNHYSTCRPFNEFRIPKLDIHSWDVLMDALYALFRKCSSHPQPRLMLNYSNLYTCLNSTKVISPDRLVDMVEDCAYGDDESHPESCSLNNSNHRFKCNVEHRTICLARVRVGDDVKDCTDLSDETDKLSDDPKTVISFPNICDRYTTLFPILINGRNETDETDCAYFPCNNTYTRCNGRWNCPDGVDEVNCEQPAICPSMHHLCLSPATSNLTCLPVKRVNDDVIDCLGATDEREFCRQSCNDFMCPLYRCWNSSICIDSTSACSNRCPVTANISMSFCQDIRMYSVLSCLLVRPRNLIEQFLCGLQFTSSGAMAYLSLSISSHYGSLSSSIVEQKSSLSKRAVSITNIISNSPLDENIQLAWYCIRGIAVRHSSDDINNGSLVCFCPPAYYGRYCEYQNQRVSLSIQVQVSSDWYIVFAVIVTLRDDQQGLIESYDKFNYLPIRHCRKKFNVYLLYATRPKNTSTNYFVRIDIYNKHTLEFRASWSFPILFPFLPVHRISVQLSVPRTKTISSDCQTLKCGIHGHCLKYVNTNISFCQCDNEWSGIHCNIQHRCHCSSDALCLDSNICVCPLKKFGSRCYLRHPMCSCKNGGSCTRNDDLISEENEFQCVCLEGFSGPNCEIIDTTILIAFASDVTIPASIHVHFIRARGAQTPHNHTTMIKKIPLDQNTIIIYTMNPFHIVFVETEPKVYYLSVFQLVHTPSIRISSTLTQSQRCLPINELFNASFVAMHLIRRIKYYHLPCKQHTNLACFHDNSYMCLCNHDLHQANCFAFDYNITGNCNEQNLCENNGQCFQDNPACPTPFVCICDDCSYGSRCQFSTKGLSLSLDIILGYQIRPNISFTEQRVVIKVTTTVVTVMVVLGLLNGILSIMSFYGKKTREVGCGYYLFASSCLSILIILIFALKFFILIVIQMSSITNRDYIYMNCKSMEYLIKTLMNTIGWLHACVSVERAMVATNETKAKHTKSKQLAKWIIIGTCVITITTHIQDPVYRRLIDDEEEKRTWCIVEFTPPVQSFNSVISLLHFLLPFALNIISAFIIIINVARRRSIAQKQQPYMQHLRQQFYQLKHLLISPLVFILLALPQLIISFMSGCLKSPRTPWMYLFGNLLSYVPSMLTFIVFVLPSKVYLDEFKETVKRIQAITHRH